VAKNVFLWPGRTWLRKGLEAGFTVLIELLWPKRRIMEVYLNVTEMGEGVFGAEAAARHWWRTDAAELGPQRSARLMAILPDPRNRSPAAATRYLVRRGAAIQKGAATLRADGRAACFLRDERLRASGSVALAALGKTRAFTSVVNDWQRRPGINVVRH
jgi:monofunctional biosynthetic peptidoglycan transglycosylase